MKAEICKYECNISIRVSDIRYFQAAVFVWYIHKVEVFEVFPGLLWK